MRKILVLISALLLSQMTFAQDSSDDLAKKAKELTKAYQVELSMDASQRALFEGKVAEFLMREAKIKAMDIPDREKPFMLMQLNEQEVEEMQNILSAKQLKKYTKARQKIQPAHSMTPQ